ncbi:MAG: hypothetical protein J5885_02585 [Clostridia bacterium]|nr:hypothetical protein [Clostridia bacterium]
MKGLVKLFKRVPKAKVTKLAYAFVGMIVSGAILIAATTSMAWYSNNRRTNSNDMAIRSNVDDAEVDYVVYLKGEDETVNSSQRISDEVKFRTYDTIFLARNKDNPVIVRITLTSPRLQALESGTMTLVLDRAHIMDGLTELNLEKTSSYFSSLMLFAAAVENPTTYSGYADNDALYSGVIGTYFNDTTNTPIFKDTVNTYSFVSGNTKINTLEIPVNYTAGDWNDEDELNIYLMINYDKSRVVSDGFAAADMTAGLLMTEKILANDLSRITLTSSRD